MRKRSVCLHGHRTSITLEPEFWDGLEAIAKSRKLSLQKLLEELDEVRRLEGGLASALRLYVLRYYRDISAL